MTATVSPASLTIETALIATSDIAVPVSFGFHPYLGLPDVPREERRVHLPPMPLTLDARKIPTGAAVPFGGSRGKAWHTRLRRRLRPARRAGHLISGRGQSPPLRGPPGRLSLTQVYALLGYDYLAFEPMTAPANALISARRLRLIRSPATRSAPSVRFIGSSQGYFSWYRPRRLA